MGTFAQFLLCHLVEGLVGSENLASRHTGGPQEPFTGKILQVSPFHVAHAVHTSHSQLMYFWVNVLDWGYALRE